MRHSLGESVGALLWTEVASPSGRSVSSSFVELSHTNYRISPMGSGVRPFGVSLLVAGFDNARGHTLYQVDPSGSFWAWKASAIGKNQVNAKTFLEKR